MKKELLPVHVRNKQAKTEQQFNRKKLFSLSFFWQTSGSLRNISKHFAGISWKKKSENFTTKQRIINQQMSRNHWLDRRQIPKGIENPKPPESHFLLFFSSRIKSNRRDWEHSKKNNERKSERERGKTSDWRASLFVSVRAMNSYLYIV